jgi:hypothetical protein
VDEHGHARERVEHGGQVADVIVVVVREQHVGDLEAVGLRLGDQRLDRAARVDEERLAVAVADQVRAREETVAEGALEDHALRC